jgi:hypothetical protein
MFAIAPRLLLELGLLLGVVGAGVTATGAAMFLWSPSAGNGLRQRWWTLSGAILMGIGFIVQLAGQLAR